MKKEFTMEVQIEKKINFLDLSYLLVECRGIKIDRKVKEETYSTFTKLTVRDSKIRK